MEGREKMPDLIKDHYQDQILAFCEFTINTWGRLPDDADLRARFNKGLEGELTVADLTGWINSPSCVAGLVAVGYTASFLHRLYSKRGADPGELGLRPLFVETLTREQIDALSTVHDVYDPRPINRKLNELGISTQTFSAWLLDPVFKNAFLEQLKTTVELSRLAAMHALAIKAGAGDNISIAQMGSILQGIQSSSSGTGGSDRREPDRRGPERPAIVEASRVVRGSEGF